MRYREPINLMGRVMVSLPVLSLPAPGSAIGPNPAGLDKGVAPPAGADRQQTVSARLVAALVHRGHGIDAICFFLALARDFLLDAMVKLDLPTPPDAPFRPRGGAHAWTQDDYRRLLNAWENDWRCGAIAETLGRSKSSVWAKARRLGLPKRDRHVLLQPAIIESPRRRQLDLFPLISTDTEAWPPPATIREWKPLGTDADVTIRRKSGRDNEVEWDKELRDHVQNRFWSGQRNKAIARDLGITLRAITSMKCRMEIPRKMPREWLSDVYRPEKVAEHIAAMNYVERQCRKNPDYTFWAKRGARPHSRRDLWGGYYAGSE